MVRNDIVDRAVDDGVEQLLPVLLVSDRRTTLELRCVARNLLGPEGQVMEAGLDCEIPYALFASLPDLRERF